MSTYSAELAWSRISPIPVCTKNKHLDVDVTYWCGIGMTTAQAFTVACHLYLGIRPTFQTRENLWQNIKQVFYSGGLAHSDSDSAILQISLSVPQREEGRHMYAFLYRELSTRTKDSSLTPTPAELFSWFHPNNVSHQTTETS